MLKNLGKTQNHQVNIAVWGPSNAGKDWLIQGFKKEIDSFNIDDKRYYYDIRERNPANAIDDIVDEVILPEAGTVAPVDREYIFIRSPKSNNNHSVTIPQEHHIIIHNDAGGHQVNAQNDPANFAETLTALEISKNILLVLGPPEPDQTGMTEPEMGSDNDSELHIPFTQDIGENAWRKQDYIRFVKTFFSAIGEKQKRNIALCMTKCDLLGFRGDEENMLLRRYGQEMMNELILQKQKGRHNIGIFATSASGFLKSEDGKLISNQNKRSLINSEKWEPLNCALPFFWFFEIIEKERSSRILRSGESGYPMTNRFH